MEIQEVVQVNFQEERNIHLMKIQKRSHLFGNLELEVILITKDLQEDFKMETL